MKLVTVSCDIFQSYIKCNEEEYCRDISLHAVTRFLKECAWPDEFTHQRHWIIWNYANEREAVLLVEDFKLEKFQYFKW